MWLSLMMFQPTPQSGMCLQVGAQRGDGGRERAMGRVSHERDVACPPPVFGYSFPRCITYCGD